jgi:predicted AAA+ superfamily ATPase
MPDMDLRLLRTMQENNTWWSTGRIREELSMPFHRSDYYRYIDCLNQPEVEIVYGPRQVGKTTTMHQIIDFLLSDAGVVPGRVLYLCLDWATLSLSNSPLPEALSLYEELILSEQFSQLSDKVYVFIDEASRTTDWARVLKNIVDKKYKIKFFVTGSSSPALFEKSSESLVGRMRGHLMLPLKFRDMLRYQLPGHDAELHNVAASLRQGMAKSLDSDGPAEYYEALCRAYSGIDESLETSVRSLLASYFLRGGYPALYHRRLSWAESSAMLREGYFSQTLLYDLVRVFDIRNDEALRRIYLYIAENTSSRINLSNVVGDMGPNSISLPVAYDYVSYLEKTHLISRSYHYGNKKSRGGKKVPKMYVQDVGMRHAVLGFTEQTLERDNSQLGYIAETVVNDHLRRLQYCLDPSSVSTMYFWQTRQQKEIDFIAELRSRPVPVEVKYQSSVSYRDGGALSKFLSEDTSSPFGIVLTKTDFRKEDNVLYVPLWLFLLHC